MLFVDGNNVPAPRRPWHRREHGGPHNLVADVARLTRDWAECADVVFDGFPRAGLRHGAVVSGVRVWFSRWHLADDWIVAHASACPTGEILVVTSDRLLARRVQAVGGRTVASETLRRALDIVGASACADASSTPLTRGPEALLGLDARSRAPCGGVEPPTGAPSRPLTPRPFEPRLAPAAARTGGCTRD